MSLTQPQDAVAVSIFYTASEPQEVIAIQWMGEDSDQCLDPIGTPVRATQDDVRQISTRESIEGFGGEDTAGNLNLTWLDEDTRVHEYGYTVIASEDEDATGTETGSAFPEYRLVLRVDWQGIDEVADFATMNLGKINDLLTQEDWTHTTIWLDGRSLGQLVGSAPFRSELDSAFKACATTMHPEVPEGLLNAEYEKFLEDNDDPTDSYGLGGETLESLIEAVYESAVVTMDYDRKNTADRIGWLVERDRMSDSGLTSYLGDFEDDYDTESLLRAIRDCEDEVIETIAERFVAESYDRDGSEWSERDEDEWLHLAWQDADWDGLLAPILERHTRDTSTSGAALAADLYLMGFNAETFSQVTPNKDGAPVDPRRIRQWCDGDRPIPGAIWEHVAALRAEHDALVDEWEYTETTISLPDGPRPPGWYKAAAARVRAIRPDARLAWQ